MNFPIWNYPYAACFASASIVPSPKGDMGISASLLRGAKLRLPLFYPPVLARG